MKISNPKWANRQHTQIDLTVQIEKLQELGFLPVGKHRFTADQNDIHEHSRELFEQAAAGAFGHIAEWGV